MSPRIAIIIYTQYGHIAKMAEAIKEAIVDKHGNVDIYQVAETLSDEILTKMKAPAKPNYPIATPHTLKDYNAFMFGIPTRFGNMPAQVKTFWDATGKLWVNGDLAGKYAGVFVSTSSAGGGQEMTPLTFMSTLVHHGIIFVPLGYGSGLMEILRKNSEKNEGHGGSPWGAGTFAGLGGERVPSKIELDIARTQGEAFYDIVSRVNIA